MSDDKAAAAVASAPSASAESSDDDPRRTYDYIVVGSGPSASGFLWGLLSSSSTSSLSSETLSPSQSLSPSRPVRIAVVERGSQSCRESSRKCSPEAAAAQGRSLPLSDWFKGSHDPDHPNTEMLRGTISLFGDDDGDGVEKKRGGWCRVVDVPVGRGWGGTALVNAGLCHLPLPGDFRDWPEPYRGQLLDSCRAVRRRLIRNRCLVSLRDGSPIDEEDEGGKGEEETATLLTSTYWEGLLLDGPRSERIGCPTSHGCLAQQVHFIEGRVERLLFEDADHSLDANEDGRLLPPPPRRVVGVEYSPTKNKISGVSYRSLFATRDVVLCAGAFETPALLLVSGIGDCRHLDQVRSDSEEEPIDEDDPSAGTRESDQDHAAIESENFSLPRASSASPVVSDPCIEDETLSPPHLLRRRRARCRLPVVEGLKDHVVLSRAVMVRRPVKPTINGVLSLHNVRIEPSHQFQVGAIEGTAYDSILPVVVPGWFRWERHPRGISRKPLQVGDLGRWMEPALALLYRAVKVLVAGIVGSRFLPVYWLLRRHVVTVSIFLMNPASAGSVKIKLRRRLSVDHKQSHPSGMPNALASRGSPGMSTTSPAHPLRRRDVELEVRLGYLDAKEDVDALRKGWIASRAMLETLLGTATIEVFPGLLIQRFCPRWVSRRGFSLMMEEDNGCFEMFARATCLPYFHWCGSCRMTTSPEDELGVVTADLQVRGYRGLRICDASVFPSTISCPTSLSCAALGHLLGSRIQIGHDGRGLPNSCHEKRETLAARMRAQLAQKRLLY